MGKKRAIKGNPKAVGITLVSVVLALVLLSLFLVKAGQIKHYREQLVILASGYMEMQSTYDGVTVKVREDNRDKLVSLWANTKIYAPKQKPQPDADYIEYHFFDDEKDYVVDTYVVDSETLLITVKGSDGTEYSVNAQNAGRFSNYVTLGTPDGWECINIIVD